MRRDRADNAFVWVLDGDLQGLGGAARVADVLVLPRSPRRGDRDSAGREGGGVTRPLPTSGRTARGGTDTWDVQVTVTVRARNQFAARERLERWCSDLIARDSVECVAVEAAVPSEWEA